MGYTVFASSPPSCHVMLMNFLLDEALDCLDRPIVQLYLAEDVVDVTFRLRPWASQSSVGATRVMKWVY